MEQKEKTDFEKIITLFREKSNTKYQVYQNTKHVFATLKTVCRDISNDLKKELTKHKIGKIPVEFRDKNDFEADLKFAGDILLFVMHTNIFEFPRNHPIMKSSYISDDEDRSYCGAIYVYNFLADTFKYNRMNDTGYLVARIFVNKEFHFLVEGKRQFSFLSHTFNQEKIDYKVLRRVVETAIIYCLDFDLLLPPYDDVKEVTLQAMQEYSSDMMIKTGKRLGFQFNADSNEKLNSK